MEEFLETDPLLVRKKKLLDLIKSGEEPFKKRFARTHIIESLREKFGGIASGTETGEIVRIAGRLMTFRYHGKATFADIRDGSERIQLFTSRDVLGEKLYKKFCDLDIGDIVGIEGEVFKTRRGELSVKVQKYELLAKALRPLPEKWHGLRDIETRYRQRYVDLIVNEQVREIFIIRSKVIKLLREFLDKKGFIEVETPMLQPVPGGATARPFITHHNALDMDLYMRVAPELYLKRLVVGGFEKVYELNRNFRNEGISVRHNPEFTMLEFYQAYVDYNDMMDLVEDLLNYVVINVKGTLIFEYQGMELNFEKPWERLTMLEAIKEYGNLEVSFDMEVDELRKIAESSGVDVKPYYGKGKLITEIFEKTAETKIAGPVIVYDYPEEVSPLAKKKKDAPYLTEHFEVIAGGLEIGPSFSELNDPVDQAERFKEQVNLLKRGEEEAQHYDYDYIRALEYGLPPTGGAGIGIDRLVMLLTNMHSIREVILFPHLRPESRVDED